MRYAHRLGGSLGNSVTLSEFDTLPFVINIWLEDTGLEGGRVTWRGHITHVPSGERRYLQDLDVITAFIAPYLEGMGVKTRVWWRVRRWWRL
jgi:hypothetical protein